ncbi:unnamed protein product [Meloidogyne enterolobii]|uniref:Uncharacterized protein n=1 Tax=Meloidogyne enterolobii TaxID=390850 RepID=A0ACB1ASS3_MELEN
MLLMNCLPLSDTTTLGQPNFVIKLFVNACDTVNAVWFSMGTATNHFEKESTTVNIYL